MSSPSNLFSRMSSKASPRVVEIMDVAGTCSYKATWNIIVSTLKLKPKITNNLGHDRWRVLHITEYKLQQRLNAPLQLPRTLFKHPPEHLFTNSRENLPQRPFRSLALLLMSCIDLRLQELYVRRVRLSLLRLEVRFLSLHERRVRIRGRLENTVVVVVRNWGVRSKIRRGRPSRSLSRRRPVRRSRRIEHRRRLRLWLLPISGNGSKKSLQF